MDFLFSSASELSIVQYILYLCGSSLISSASAPLHNCTNIVLFYIFFCLSGRFPSLPWVVYTLLHNDPAAHQDHCGRCRIRTRDLCPWSLVRNQWTTTFPCNVHCTVQYIVVWTSYPAQQKSRCIVYILKMISQVSGTSPVETWRTKKFIYLIPSSGQALLKLERAKCQVFYLSNPEFDIIDLLVHVVNAG